MARGPRHSSQRSSNAGRRTAAAVDSVPAAFFVIHASPLTTMGQRTNYLRQTLPTYQRENAVAMLWTVTGLSGPFIEVKLTGPRDGLTIVGVPSITTLNSGATAIGCVEVASPDPASYSLLQVEFDSGLAAADLFTLAAASPAVRNRWGGMMAPAQQAFPTPFIVDSSIDMQLNSYSGQDIYFDFNTVFQPVCIGPTATVENVTASELATFMGWSGVQAHFQFSTPLTPGDIIQWPAAQDSFKNQFGGTLNGNSIALP